MKLHPRHYPYTKASIDIRAAIEAAQTRHELTSAETLAILAECLQSLSNQVIRAERLPEGWQALPEEYLNDGQQLQIRRLDGRWRLFHRGSMTSHEFDTVVEAIDHAEDVIYHGH